MMVNSEKNKRENKEVIFDFIAVIWVVLRTRNLRKKNHYTSRNEYLISVYLFLSSACEGTYNHTTVNSEGCEHLYTLVLNLK